MIPVHPKVFVLITSFAGNKSGIQKDMTDNDKTI